MADAGSEAKLAAFVKTFFSPTFLYGCAALLFVLFSVGCIVWSLEMIGNEEVRFRKVKYFHENPFLGVAEATAWAASTLTQDSFNKTPVHPVSRGFSTQGGFAPST